MNSADVRRRSLRAARGRAALAVALVLVVLGCGSPTSSVPSASTSGPSTSGPPTSAPSTSNTPAVSVAPTAGIDANSAELVRRLRTPAYTSDTTDAVVEILARSGVETFETATATTPQRAAQGGVSPFRLLDFQTHALAVGAWAGGGLTGAELDDLLPVTSDDGSLPPISAVLAGYVAAADSPGAAVARGLLEGENLLEPQSIQFPTLVLVLFASDVATDGGTVSAGSRITLAVAAGVPPDGAAAVAIPGTLCSDAANFIDGAIHDLFAALKVATPAGGVGRIIASIWNWIVDQGERFVRTLVRAVTDAVLGTIRTIAGAIAAVAEQVASLLPYAVGVRTLQSTASGSSYASTFFLLPDSQLGGRFDTTVTAGDLPDWPPLLADCAASAQVALPSFRGRELPVIWGPLRGAAGQFVGGILADGATDSQGEAHWTFVTSLDPGSPAAQEVTATGQMPVVVHRPEIEQARNHLVEALLAPIPELLRGFVGRLFAPFVDTLQGRLNALLDARGKADITIVYHSGSRPTPGPTTASAPPSTVPTQGSAGVPVACALLSADQVGAVIGEPVTAAENPDTIINPAIQSNCYYAGESRAAIALNVTAPGSLAAIIAQRSVTPIPGVGDQAYTWNIGATSYAAAQVGDVVLMVTLSTTAYPAAAATTLLKLAVSRL